MLAHKSKWIAVILTLFILVPAFGAQQAQKPLTNADVVAMLTQGEQEQAILNKVRTRTSAFDVSKQARAEFDKRCAAIKHPGVTASAWATEIKHIWDTMVSVVICLETNGRGGEGACDSIPRPIN
ncbi:MAG TPA: hypothetical protein VKB26_06310 [Candidatus Acidoferrales bacterium]|nr:hypothetical protein [Candidatus Acidoferrales bacterium]